jgi:hypothetical protein
MKNMDNELPVHPLETFPRRELSMGISRRKFFATLATEMSLKAGQTEGASAVRIPVLGTMSDEQLMDFIPVILTGCDIEIRDGMVCGRLENWSKPNVLFTLDHLSSFCFNQNNGRNNLRAIAQNIEAEFGLPFERAFALARGMFLTLVRAGVCLPLNNPLLG